MVQDLYAYHLDSPAPKTYFSRWWTRSLSAVKESLESLMMLLYMAKMMQNMTDIYTISCKLPMNMDSSSTGRNVMWKPTSVTFLWYSLWQRWSPSRPQEGRSNPQDASTRGTTGTPEVFQDDHILVTIYPFSTQEGHRVHMEQPLTRMPLTQ